MRNVVYTDMKTHNSVNCVITAIVFAVIAFMSPALAVIPASETHGSVMSGTDVGYAWSDQIGWVNFACTNCNVSITDSGITGYAWNNNYGWINLAPTNSGVMAADNGALSGYAWGEGVGWINFSGVAISEFGVLSGEATGDVIGTLTFDCDNCSVTTNYVPQNFREEEDTSSSSGGGGRGNRSTEEADNSEEVLEPALALTPEKEAPRQMSTEEESPPESSVSQEDPSPVRGNPPASTPSSDRQAEQTIVSALDTIVRTWPGVLGTTFVIALFIVLLVLIARRHKNRPD